jgi:uncharacterized protein
MARFLARRLVEVLSDTQVEIMEPMMNQDRGMGILSDAPRRKERRGFASMSADKQREIASKGGKAAHRKGTAHQWSSDEAREAGRKGGQISRGGRGRVDRAEPAMA